MCTRAYLGADSGTLWAACPNTLPVNSSLFDSQFTTTWLKILCCMNQVITYSRHMDTGNSSRLQPCLCYLFFCFFFPNCLSVSLLAAWPLWCVRHSAGIINVGAKSASVLTPMGHDKIHVATFARPQAFSEGGGKVQRAQGELWIEISHYLQKNTFPRGSKWRLQKDTLFFAIQTHCRK